MEDLGNNPTPNKPSNYDDATFSTVITDVKTVDIGGNTGVVKKISYYIEVNWSGFKKRHIHTIDYLDEDLSELSDITPFDQLTEAQVIGWINQRIDRTSIEYSLCNIILPPDLSSEGTSQALPWA
jgi:hypothetical protein